MAGSKVPNSSHKKSQFWLELVQAQATSGLGIADFCKQQNVSDSAVELDGSPILIRHHPMIE